MSEDDAEMRRALQRALADQDEARVEGLGRVVGTLYANLISSGTPPRLAATITRDWHYLQLSRTLWPNQPPSAPFWDISGADGEAEASDAGEPA